VLLGAVVLVEGLTDKFHFGMLCPDANCVTISEGGNDHIVISDHFHSGHTWAEGYGYNGAFQVSYADWYVRTYGHLPPVGQCPTSTCHTFNGTFLPLPQTSIDPRGLLITLFAGTLGTVLSQTATSTLSDDALVVRGGTNTVETLTKGYGTHPSGVTGVSVESADGKTIEQLIQESPTIGSRYGKVGCCTTGDVRAAGGDVIPTSGLSPNHATLTGLSPQEIHDLLEIIDNPVK
jgi:hypothetical protein